MLDHDHINIENLIALMPPGDSGSSGDLRGSGIDLTSQRSQVQILYRSL
jgi:hypothetical protein